MIASSTEAWFSGESQKVNSNHGSLGCHLSPREPQPSQVIRSNPDEECVRIASRGPFPRAMQTALDQPQPERSVFIKRGVKNGSLNESSFFSGLAASRFHQISANSRNLRAFHPSHPDFRALSGIRSSHRTQWFTIRVASCDAMISPLIIIGRSERRRSCYENMLRKSLVNVFSFLCSWK